MLDFFPEETEASANRRYLSFLVEFHNASSCIEQMGSSEHDRSSAGQRSSYRPHDKGN